MLGQRRTVIVGAVLMAIGHFMMAVEQLFLLALAALILGNGAFKPNISTQVGRLYAPGDRRRDRAYSIFYVGINIGAFLAPLVCGTLGEKAGWHYGFAAAGVGMLIGLSIYLYALPLLPEDELHKARTSPAVRKPLGRNEGRAVIALLVLFLPTALFFGDLRADRQQHSLMGRHLHRSHHQRVRLERANPDHLVSGLQSLHDLCLHAVHRCVVDPSGGAWR